MKIVQLGDYTGNIVETVLQNRNIENIELFLNPDDSTDSHPLEFTNAIEGRTLLYEHLEEKNKITIVVDADADGYTSAAILYQYLKDIDENINIHYIVHDSKAHGLTENIVNNIIISNTDLVIIPDAGSNDVEQLEKLYQKGFEVLILDHHVVTKFTEKAVVVNNQLCPLTNHNLVGAGVVYKFIKGIDMVKGYNYADKYLDLVAIGQIGDASDISNIEIRNMVKKGLEKINNKFLKVAIGEKIGLCKSVTAKDLSFNVIPLINAVTRVGTLEERKILFEALCGIDENRVFPIIKRKKNKDTGKFDQVQFNFNVFEYGFDLCVKAKARQDAIVKKMTAALETSVIDDTGVIIAFSDNNDNPGITGLIANKLAAKFDKPALLLNEQEDTFTGSGRGHEKTLVDFRKWCEDSGLVEFAQGHDNAFGISIKKENLEAFKEYSRSVEKQEVIYEVDIITNKPSKEDCELIDKNKYLFGGSVVEPFIGIVGLVVPKRFISLRGSVLTIYSWGVSCVKFGSTEEQFDELQNYPEDNVKLNLVGHYGMNNWSGREVPQLIIKDYQIVYEEEEEVTVENIIF